MCGILYYRNTGNKPGEFAENTEFSQFARGYTPVSKILGVHTGALITGGGRGEKLAVGCHSRSGAPPLVSVLLVLRCIHKGSMVYLWTMLGSRHGRRHARRWLACMHPRDTRSAHLSIPAALQQGCAYRVQNSPPPPVRAAAARPPLAHALIISSSLVSYFGSVAWTIWLG